MKNAFYLILKALFVLEVFTFLPQLFGYVEKQPNKVKKIYLCYQLHAEKNNGSVSREAFYFLTGEKKFNPELKCSLINQLKREKCKY